VQQGSDPIRSQVLTQLKATIEGLLAAERDRRIEQFRQSGQKVYRWAYTVRKCWQTLWGMLEQVRVPRWRGTAEVGLLEKYQRHCLDEVLFALAVGGLSQRKVVEWMLRFLGGTLSPATLTHILADAREQVEARRKQRLSAEQFVAIVTDGIHLRYRRRGLFERWVLRPLLIRPYRCLACEERYYGFVSPSRRLKDRDRGKGAGM
jgi:transposase-like protein